MQQSLIDDFNNQASIVARLQVLLEAVVSGETEPRVVAKFLAGQFWTTDDLDTVWEAYVAVTNAAMNELTKDGTDGKNEVLGHLIARATSHYRICLLIRAGIIQIDTSP